MITAVSVDLASTGGAQSTGSATAPERTESPDRHRHRHHGRPEEAPQPGRRQIQRGLKHLLREVKADIRSELKELKDNGELDPEYAKAVKGLVREFRDDLKDAFHDAGRGHDFDPATLRDAVGKAMSDLTAGLAALREGRETAETQPVSPPADKPLGEPDTGLVDPADQNAEAAAVPVATPTEPAAATVPAEGFIRLAFTAQFTVSFGLMIDQKV